MRICWLQQGRTSVLKGFSCWLPGRIFVLVYTFEVLTWIFLQPFFIFSKDLYILNEMELFLFCIFDCCNSTWCELFCWAGCGGPCFFVSLLVRLPLFPIIFLSPLYLSLHDYRNYFLRSEFEIFFRAYSWYLGYCFGFCSVLDFSGVWNCSFVRSV